MPGRESGRRLDAMVINTSGCGATVKDYGYMLREDPRYAEKAARIAALAKDVCEFLARARPRGAGARDGAARRLSRRLLAAARPARARRAEAPPAERGVSTCSRFPRGISAAARPAPTTCCSRSSRRALRARKVAQCREHPPRADRSRQYRLHHADRVGHDYSGRAYGRAARLGDRRAGRPMRSARSGRSAAAAAI